MIRKIIKKFLYKYKSSSEDYINYLRNIGVKVGKHVHIFCPKETFIDINNPHLLKIGDHVNMTGPITILTHDYSTCVLNNIDKEIYGKQKDTIIGNNVFLGWGCTILAGTIIGDNCIIGAESVVHGKIEENSVYAGNPAKKIMSIEEYRNKIIDNQLKEAKNIYIQYRECYGVKPSVDVFHEYFYLFCNKHNLLNEKLKNKLKEENISIRQFEEHKTCFNSYEEFTRYYEGEEKNEKN